RPAGSRRGGGRACARRPRRPRWGRWSRTSPARLRCPRRTRPTRPASPRRSSVAAPRAASCHGLMVRCQGRAVLTTVGPTPPARRRTSVTTAPIDPTTTSAWAALAAHRDATTPDLRAWFAQDADRARRLSFEVGDLHVDLSKNLVTDETLALLVRLAEE